MNIVIVGAGSFGTALGNILAKRGEFDLSILARDKNIASSINTLHVNEKYYPNFHLISGLSATTDKSVLKKAEITFLAIPSTQIIDYVIENRDCFAPGAAIVVLSKGFGQGQKTIVQSLSEHMSNPLVSFKGPTFAADLIQSNPTGFTVACRDKSLFDLFQKIFKKTNIYLDFSTDVLGVEITSALKNIYAILLGIIDAYFNSANTRFLILTKAFNELKNAVIVLGGSEDTWYKYCGFGDFGVTALNDLSRNRTLGLLMGKGFLDNSISNSVILEGKRTLSITYNAVRTRGDFYLMEELYKLFNKEYKVHELIRNLFQRIREG
jgi:glycerol-3-phosphate dehydrogenase (NAD(P)+)